MRGGEKDAVETGLRVPLYLGEIRETDDGMISQRIQYSPSPECVMITVQIK